MRYDPAVAPDSSEWLQAADDERLQGVRRYHRHAGEVAGNLRLHAVVHVTVETQLAEGVPATVEAMERLLAEGLDRHDAVHAIGSAVTEQMYAAVQGCAFDAAAYEVKLRSITAEGGRDST